LFSHFIFPKALILLYSIYTTKSILVLFGVIYLEVLNCNYGEFFMPSNRRVIFSNSCAGIAADGSNSFTPIKGLQSFSTSINFNLTPYNEIGQTSLYENVEGTPDVSIQMSKLLDGYPPLTCLVTQGATEATLISRAAQKCIFGFAVHMDTVSAATGVPLSETLCSGAQLASLSFNFPSDGTFTEDVSLTALEQVFKTGSFLLTNFGTATFGNDVPASLYGSGGVQQRENLIYFTNAALTTLDANGSYDTDEITLLPQLIDGITASGANAVGSDGFTAHVQNISVSADLGREDIFELGRRTKYAQFANPLNEVTTSITTLATLGSQLTATEAGVYGDGNNLRNYTIKIRCEEGLLVDCGTQNKLASQEYGGGDAGGGNAQITYSFTNFNDLTVRHVADPTVALRIEHPDPA
jgi:hypothetical protein